MQSSAQRNRKSGTLIIRFLIQFASIWTIENEQKDNQKKLQTEDLGIALNISKPVFTATCRTASLDSLMHQPVSTLPSLTACANTVMAFTHSRYAYTAALCLSFTSLCTAARRRASHFHGPAAVATPGPRPCCAVPPAPMQLWCVRRTSRLRSHRVRCAALHWG